MAETELKCTCPSGDGSLRWPCPQHPPCGVTPPADDRVSEILRAAGIPDASCRTLYAGHELCFSWERVISLICAVTAANLRGKLVHLPNTILQRPENAGKPPTLEDYSHIEPLAGQDWNAPISTASQIDPRQATPPGRWSEDVPTEAGSYWHWNGRQGSLPVLITGIYSLGLQQLVGAGGEPLAMLRGYWWRIYQPPTTGITPQQNNTTT
jgi:hypothetical protein